MKIRSGFVSNSSSSSFVAFVKSNNNNERDILLNKLKEIFKIDNNLHPLYNLSVSIPEHIVDTCEIISSEEEYEEYFLLIEEEVKERFKNGYKVLYREFSDEGYLNEEVTNIDYYICYLDLNYKFENVIIEKDEGY